MTLFRHTFTGFMTLDVTWCLCASVSSTVFDAKYMVLQRESMFCLNSNLMLEKKSQLYISTFSLYMTSSLYVFKLPIP